MTLVGFAFRNAFLRNGTRSTLTVLGVLVASLALVFLRTVLGAWYAGGRASASDRIVTRNALSITQPLPLSYRDRITKLPGVAIVNWSTWFGGVYKDRKNFFAQFATDPESALELVDMHFLEGDRQAFVSDRNGCIVGRKLAGKYGFKIGETVALQGDIYPGEWRFTVRGVVESADDPSIDNTLYFHWARLNEQLPAWRKDQVGIYVIKVRSASESARVVKEIDALFANSANETTSESERAFRLQFVAGSSAILSALHAVSGVILVIMAFVLGNTLAIGLRERTSELGTLRALGYLPRHVQLLALGEGAMLGAVGGVLGVAVAWRMLRGFEKLLADLGFLSGIALSPVTAVGTLLATTVVGALAGAIPARGASRMSVVAALGRQE